MSKLKNTVDLTGKVFGRLTVLSFDCVRKVGVGTALYWKCRCECGVEKSINGSSLKSGKVISCGCYNKEATSKRFLDDLTGRVFGRLTVIKKVKRENCQKNTYWLCKCECGNEKEILGTSLKNGSTISCGCYMREIHKKINTKEYGEASFNMLFRRYQKDAQNKDIFFDITKDQFRTFTKQNCFYCGKEPSQIILASENTNGEYIYNGIDRIDNNEGYVMPNLVPCCKDCNFAKRNKTVDEYREFIKRSYDYMFSTKTT